METLIWMVGAGVMAMLLLIPTCLVRGRRLKDYVRQHHPDLFGQMYGDGSLLGKSSRNDISRARFVHGSTGPNDSSLSELRVSLRTSERLYLLAFLVTVMSFIAFAVAT
jgi:hypothetical protein